MFGILISAAIFLAVFLGIFWINLALTDIFKEDRSEQLKVMEAELREQMRQHARKSTQQEELANLHIKTDGPSPFSIVDWIKKFRATVNQAGLKTDPQQIWFIGLVAGAAVGMLLFFFTSSLPLAVAAFALGACFPFFYILHKRKQRMNVLSEQLPDALELMARVLRAGQTITQAMNGVADEFKDPIGTEFGYCYEQQNLGLPLEIALGNMVERTGLMEVKILVMAVLIQRQAGGNLAELLDNLSDVMRKRHELRGTVQALTAEGRLQAGFLFVLPILTWCLMFFMNRSYAVKLLAHPELIYATLGLMVVGIMWIRKIINFDY